MESNNVILVNQKLEVIGILKQAAKLFAKNPSFIIFTVLTSLPFFFFLVYYETFLQGFLVKTSQILLQRRYDNFRYNWPIPFESERKLDKGFSYQLIQLCSLYLLPLHLFELSTVLVIVDLASKIYREEEIWMTFKDMVQRPIHGTTLRGSFVTFVYITILSTCYLLGLIWLVTLYFVVLRNPLCDVIFGLLCGIAFMFLLRIYLEWSAMWNMSLVISILEGVYGVEAMALSNYFSRGNERRGLILMLVFFVLGVSLRLSCLLFGCLGSERWIVAQIGLFCLGNALKWVACVVYFHDCKNRIMEKKVDEEVGKKVEAVDENKQSS
ncbi:hypothetical protein L484_027799 [Morus notabilis]|uniref:Transmembrane protein n=1 Tax=Morus notabilis TaxID=981085 RepID=W9RL00_9ROSA|nr:uncharacterized protein LOC21410407 [Morus notabilis]EXB82620.1 hypothetical protein L484_027799 [Morus notabilis]